MNRRQWVQLRLWWAAFGNKWIRKYHERQRLKRMAKEELKKERRQILFMQAMALTFDEVAKLLIEEVEEQVVNHDFQKIAVHRCQRLPHGVNGETVYDLLIHSKNPLLSAFAETSIQHYDLKTCYKIYDLFKEQLKGHKYLSFEEYSLNTTCFRGYIEELTEYTESIEIFIK